MILRYFLQHILLKDIFTKKKKILPCPHRNKGSVILIAFLLGTTALLLAMNAARVLSVDIKLVSDFVLAEKANFAAESGVEWALKELKNEPLQHIVDHDIVLNSNVTATTNINNLVPGFTIELKPGETQKFALAHDDDASTNINKVIESSLNLEVGASGAIGADLHWKLLCDDADGGNGTISLQGLLDAGSHGMRTQVGQYDSLSSYGINRNWGNVLSHLTHRDQKSCLVSLNNLHSSELLTVRITTNHTGGKIAPAITKVQAEAKVRGRKKIISFDYREQALSSLFYFGFFHYRP